MAYTINHNIDTSDEQTKTLSLNLPASTNYAVVNDTAEEVKLINMTSPIGREEAITYKFSTVADVFTKSGIDRALWTPSRRGARVLIQEKQILTASDSENPDAPEYDMPIFCNLTITAPINPYLTEADLEQIVQRAIAAIYFNSGTVQLNKLFRGAINPLRNDIVSNGI